MLCADCRVFPFVNQYKWASVVKSSRGADSFLCVKYRNSDLSELTSPILDLSRFAGGSYSARATWLSRSAFVFKGLI